MLILHKSVHFKNKNLKETIEITYYNTLNWKYVTDNKIFFKYENFLWVLALVICTIQGNMGDG